MKNFTLGLLAFACLCFSYTGTAQTPKLNSLVNAPATIFIDFDGHTVQAGGWAGGAPFICESAGLNAAQITEIFNRISEDYRPFHVNITTDSAKFIVAPVGNRIRIIVTPTSDWFPGVGGVSYIGSFVWGDDTPGFVFPNRIGWNIKNIAEACSHESGHSLGLSHQSKYNSSCALLESYSTGFGSGETGWAPVMGNSYGKNMTGWNMGPTPYDCGEQQDNLTVITTQNGFGYRSDDYAETLAPGTFTLNATAFNTTGIISTGTDKDAFKFIMAQNGSMHIDVVPFNLGANNDGANIDVKVMLYNGAKALIRTYNPANTMNVVIDTALNADTYYIVVTGTGNVNTSNYGSIGTYTASGYKGALPIHDVILKGAREKSQHRLSWNIIADEPIAAQVLEVSANGFSFEKVMADNGLANTFSNSPQANGRNYYRLKVTSVINQTMYSNIVALDENDVKQFMLSTLVQDQITVNADENFSYVVSDMNGRKIYAGKNLKGRSTIDAATLARGMYVVQMRSDNNQQTERIIKQ